VIRGAVSRKPESRRDVTALLAGYPAPTSLGAQMFAQGTICKMVAQCTQRDQSIDQAIEFAQSELKGFLTDVSFRQSEPIAYPRGFDIDISIHRADPCTIETVKPGRRFDPIDWWPNAVRSLVQRLGNVQARRPSYRG
jgi:hypothetical protein